MQMTIFVLQICCVFTYLIIIKWIFPISCTNMMFSAEYTLILCNYGKLIDGILELNQAVQVQFKFIIQSIFQIFQITLFSLSYSIPRRVGDEQREGRGSSCWTMLSNSQWCSVLWQIAPSPQAPPWTLNTSVARSICPCCVEYISFVLYKT